MFNPRFIITSKILNSIIEIEKTKLLMDIAPLEVDVEQRLKSECVAKRMFSLLRHLDCRLDINDVTKIVKDDPERDAKPSQVALRVGVVAKEVDIQRAINWLNADRLVVQTTYLSNKFKKESYGEKDLVTLNSLLGERVVTAAATGKYREDSCLEFVEIKPPASIEVSYQMEDLFLWFGGASKTDMHPVIMASVVLFEVMRIRPFEVNNLGTGIFFIKLIMASMGYGLRDVWPIEDNLLKNTDKLTEVFSNTVESGDSTGWLEFVTKMFGDAAATLRAKMMNLLGDRPAFKADGGKVISLSERQIVIMEEMTIHSEMTIKEIRGILPMVSDDTILRDLKDLILKKLLKKKGKTKGAVYVLGKVRSF